MQTTNQQHPITFQLAASVENQVLCTLDTTTSPGMVTNGGRNFHADVNLTDAAQDVTARVYTQSTPESPFSGPVYTTKLTFGTIDNVDTPITGYAVKLTLDPGDDDDVPCEVSAVILAP